jgi:hypothetical protein
MSHFCNIGGCVWGGVRNCFPMMTELFINNMIYWAQVLFWYGQVAGMKRWIDVPSVLWENKHRTGRLQTNKLTKYLMLRI